MLIIIDYLNKQIIAVYIAKRLLKKKRIISRIEIWLLWKSRDDTLE